jgi:hypothetical protein
VLKETLRQVVHHFREQAKDGSVWAVDNSKAQLEIGAGNARAALQNRNNPHFLLLNPEKYPCDS